MKAPVLCEDELQTFHSMWDIGSTGAHTKTANSGGKGFAKVDRSDTGEYTITFTKTLAGLGTLVDLHLTHWHAADATPRWLGPTVGSFVAETPSAAATVEYESWDLATPSLAELVSGDKVSITAVFLKTS
jgi:hypothetical protein